MTRPLPRLFAAATAAIVLAAACPGLAAAGKAKRPAPGKTILYKTAKNAKGNPAPLRLHAFFPEGHQASDKRPAIVFFFGGGWTGGSPSQFYPQAAYLASRGMVALAAEYRVEKQHGTPPKACVADGKSAVRYVRAHAGELGVDPKRVAAGGGSAGGHVAAATATVQGFDDPDDDTAASAVPDALVLFNPVYDNGPDGYGHDRLGDEWRQLSPAHNIRKGIPPAIVFLGTEDNLIPVATAKAFQAAMRGVHSRSELVLFEGEGHGFFNFGRGGNVAYAKTVRAMDAFLASLGWLEGKPTIEVPAKAAGR